MNSRKVHRDPTELRAGARKRLTGNMIKNAKMLDYEVNIMNHLRSNDASKNKVDLLELYSREAKPTTMAPRFGLSSLQPFDIRDGYDL